MRLLLISLIITLSISAFAQFDRINLGLVSSEQEFIKSALDSAVFILRQDYVLFDTLDNRVYKQDDKEYFGRFYTLAILTDSILITSQNIFKPYKNDTAYHYYNQRYGWKAKLTDLQYRALFSNSFYELEYDIHNLQYNDSLRDSLTILDDRKLIIPKNIEHNLIQTVQNTDDDTGWAFLVYMKQSIYISDTSAVKYSIFKARPDFNSSGKLERQTEIDNVLGGFYIIPEIRTGRIYFKPAGIIKKNEFWFVESFK